MMKNKIISGQGGRKEEQAKRRPNPAYARALAAIESALARNCTPRFTEAEKTEMWSYRLFGRRPEGMQP